MIKLLSILLTLCFSISCNKSTTALHENGKFRKFNLKSDLLLLHYDCKTDVDDLHSIAAFGSLIRTPAYSKINYRAVAGTYGIQEGAYVPPNTLIEEAFKNNWSDAHSNMEKALEDVYNKVMEVLNNRKGTIWIAEAGQSDFSAKLIAKIRANKNTINSKERIHIVQHSDWNEKTTTEEQLAYVKKYSKYHKIPDGNAAHNGTPSYNTKTPIAWADILRDKEMKKLWSLATTLADKYNGQDGRYNNPSIESGGLDFSDFSEVQWILEIKNVESCAAYLNYLRDRN